MIACVIDVITCQHFLEVIWFWLVGLEEALFLGKAKYHHDRVVAVLFLQMKLNKSLFVHLGPLSKIWHTLYVQEWKV